MKKISLKIEGMTCSACSNGLEKYLIKQDGIIDAVVNLVLQQAVIDYEDNLEIRNLEIYIEEAGFKSLGEVKENDLFKDIKQDKRVLVGMLLINIIMFLVSIYNNYYLILMFLAIAVLYLGKDIIVKGIKNIKHKNPNMDSLVMISVLSSFIYSIYSVIMILLGNNKYIEMIYFDTVAMVLFFIKLGRYIEGNSKNKTVEAIRDLVQITPEMAILKDNDKIR